MTLYILKLKHHVWVIACAIALLLTSLVSAATWYVDANAGTNGNGQFPTTPFNNLSDALAQAANLDTILIAGGI